MRIGYAHQLLAPDPSMPRPRLARPPSDKKAVNLTVAAGLVDAARAAHVNLSATLERALEDALRLKRRERWLAENAAGMAAYNESVEAHGAFADTLRSF
jgi:antitoxin CcdA